MTRTPAMTKAEHENFVSYLRNCTDRQVEGVLETERDAGRTNEIRLAIAELERRGLDVPRGARP